MEVDSLTFDVAIPTDHNAQRKSLEKVNKYQELTVHISKNMKYKQGGHSSWNWGVRIDPMLTRKPSRECWH